MMAFNHLLVVIILIRLLKLDHNEAFVAILFGFLIDLDHLMGIPSFINEHGWAAIFNMDSLLHNDIQWKSAMHGTEAFLVVSVISLLFRMYIPVLFWGVHIFMDWAQVTHWNIVAWPEPMFMLFFGTILLYIEHRIYSDSVYEGNRSWRNFLSFIWIRFVNFWKDIFPLHRIPQGCKAAAEAKRKGKKNILRHALNDCDKEPPQR